MSRYTRLLNADHDQTDIISSPTNSSSTSNAQPPPSSSPALLLGNKKMSNMLASLKESAASAGSSVRTGLGLPTHNNTNSATEDNSDTESQASNMLDEISELCPKMTYQQVRYIRSFYY